MVKTLEASLPIRLRKFSVILLRYAGPTLTGSIRIFLRSRSMLPRLLGGIEA